MECMYCRGKIGPIRRLVDREFCCKAHRLIFAQAKVRGDVIYSARLIRDIEESDDELITDDFRRKKQPKSLPLPVVLCFLLGIVVLLLLMPRSTGPAPTGPAPSYVLPGAGWLASLGGLRLAVPSVRLNESFHGGIGDWRPAELHSLSGAANDWIYRAGAVRPGRLRLWAPSLKLTDYEFDFHARIERRGLGWAFRASSRENYYGARVEIVKQSNPPLANVVHYAVYRGRQEQRVELPLPLSIHRGEQYDVAVNIRGNRFVTSINGQVVDTWTDNRLRAGGVGFFTEKGDVASIRSVNVSSDRSLWDRLFSSFILMPPVSLTN